eukprot:TRINITY_DN81312_c0_g1_i1.p1 TRINITY_DN81312_c0_g1~~TRINITY_DN81312_c0_g1_i1.p1  ORF type:complete len:350 (-),score=66.98 TRINITY_DN81312_c0_g1_i1:105-1124(-)
MPKRRSRSRRSRSRRRDRDRGRGRSTSESEGGANDGDDTGLYTVQLLPGRRQEPWPCFDLLVDEGGERVVPHVCARPDEGYVIRVTNNSRRHIACAVTVDGENALLRDGSLIVAPRDHRELQGYLVSKNFVGKEYVKEYRDFKFGKPQVIESGAGASAEAEMPYQLYGRVVCEVYEAVLDEEVESDQELRGQTTHYRGAGLNGSNEERKVPEGKKKHFLYSAVTVQGKRSTIANSTRGRWWVRGTRKIRTLELRYREAHTLMLLGVEPKRLGLASAVKEDPSVKKEEKEEEEEEKAKVGLDPLSDTIQTCDLTGDDDAAEAIWTTEQAPERVQPVDVVS